MFVINKKVTLLGESYTKLKRLTSSINTYYTLSKLKKDLYNDLYRVKINSLSTS